MKSKHLKWGTVVCIAVFLLAYDANAQRRNRANTNSSTNQPPPTSQPSSIPDGIMIVIDSSSFFDPPVQKPQRPTGSFDNLDNLSGRPVLDPEHLRWDDALYVQRVWRELDLREKLNQPFRAEATGSNGNQLFINILLDHIKAGKLAAFADERFSIPIDSQQIMTLTLGSLDTVARYTHDINNPSAYVVTRNRFDPKTVTRLRLVEEWIFDKEASKMFVRIIGLAALKTEYVPRTSIERGQSVLFWVHFPELRPILAGYQVYNPKNMGQARMTLLELFESRMFSSFIVKSTLDNPGNKPIRSYIKDPTLALLEGDNIKNKVSNYEQDLWSY